MDIWAVNVLPFKGISVHSLAHSKRGAAVQWLNSYHSLELDVLARLDDGGIRMLWQSYRQGMGDRTTAYLVKVEVNCIQEPSEKEWNS